VLAKISGNGHRARLARDGVTVSAISTYLPSLQDPVLAIHGVMRKVNFVSKTMPLNEKHLEIFIQTQVFALSRN